MSKDNSDFFKRKSAWAYTKDALLEKYLVPYTTKILATGKGLLYVDAFAGKGRFEDGSKGSPVIACEAIGEAVRISQSANKNVNMLFVEKQYASELASNLSQFPNANVRSGTFELLASSLSQVQSSANLFLYLDPFGVKSLDLNFFLNITRQFGTVEILLNFNSFGFFRAACSAYNVSYSDVEAFDDELVEREVDTESDMTRSIEMLSKAAGGDYWEVIVQDYRNERIDGYEAERRLSNEFCRRLRSSYRYVLNLPIRLKPGQRPKYRMIHMTNHEDGCLLMYDRMQKEQVQLQDIQRDGQLSLFSHDSDNQYIDERAIRESLLSAVRKLSTPCKLEIVLANFVIQNGLSLSSKELRGMLRVFEESELIKVEREPEFTERGTRSRFMESGHGKRILIGRADD